MKFTIFGSSGFIGSNLVHYLKDKGFECHTPNLRKNEGLDKFLGHAIYSIGVSDFLNKPFETIDAHVCNLKKIFESSQFDSFLYISSTRIYYDAKSTKETSPITAKPFDNNQLYNISKLLGESICLSSDRNNVRIVRSSNVIGNNAPSNLFIPSLIKSAINKNKIHLHSSLDSKKDYIYIDDLVKMIYEICIRGKYNIYNIAYGKNISTREIVEVISRITNCEVSIDDNAKEYSFPTISIDRLKKEFDFKPVLIIDKLEEMIKNYKKTLL